MRVVFLGSGAFGLPTLEMLLARHEVVLGATQPDRPAGRGRQPSPTPVAERLSREGVPLLRCEDVNAPECVAAIEAEAPDALVVIAFGQKLGPGLLADRLAINLHGSLLPRHRGAAPINWAILAGDDTVGVSVIRVVRRMDAGAILAQKGVAAGPLETAGDLHDRLALLGPGAIEEVLAAHAAGTLKGSEQDEHLATRAPKLSRADCWLRFEDDVRAVRRRVHGLSPWPGCTVRVGGHEIRLLRAIEVHAEDSGPPGTLDRRGAVRCVGGALLPREVQPTGGRVMDYASFLRGRALPPEAIVESVVPPPPGSSTGDSS